MLSKSEIVEVLKHETDQISKRYQFKFVYLAGSVAREEHHKWSDIDIFVSFPKFLEMTAEEKYRVFFAGELVYKVIGGHNAVLDNIIPDAVIVLIDSDKELASFGVKDRSDTFDLGIFSFHILGRVSRNRVHGIDSDDFGLAAQRYYLCHCYGDSYSGKTSRPGGDVNMFNFLRFFFHPPQKLLDGREKLGTVPSPP